MSALFAMVKDDHPPFPEGISANLVDFLTCCFRKDPSSRPKARELLVHKWIVELVGDMSHELSGKAGATISKGTSTGKINAPAEPAPVATPEPAPVAKPEPKPEPVAPANNAAAEQILNDLNANFQGGMGSFGAIPTLGGVMENFNAMMGLQNAFAAAGVNTPPPAFNQMLLPTGAKILDQPQREPDSDDDEEEEEEEETEEQLREKALNKDIQTIKEYIMWINQAIKTEKASRAVKIRKALRKSLPPMRVKYHDYQAARDIVKEARGVLRQVEETFSDNLGIDTDDSDYDSEDSFFMESDGEDTYF